MTANERKKVRIEDVCNDFNKNCKVFRHFSNKWKCRVDRIPPIVDKDTYLGVDLSIKDLLFGCTQSAR